MGNISDSQAKATKGGDYSDGVLLDFQENSTNTKGKGINRKQFNIVIAQSNMINKTLLNSPKSAAARNINETNLAPKANTTKNDNSNVSTNDSAGKETSNNTGTAYNGTSAVETNSTNTNQTIDANNSTVKLLGTGLLC
jgi:hypothetical protein